MTRWITVITLTRSFEAETVKGRLESEGIKVFIKNSAINQIYPLDNKILGGLEVQVRADDVVAAVDILREIGYRIKRHETNSILHYIDTHSKVIPFIGVLQVEYRILILASIPALMIALAIVLLAV